MNPLLRSSLELEVDQVLDPAATLPHVYAAHAHAGQRYLIVRIIGDEAAGTWICAPISERALDCVVGGKADLRDAVAHSATGAVHVVIVDPDGGYFESDKECRDLVDEDLPASGDRISGQPITGPSPTDRPSSTDGPSSTDRPSSPSGRSHRSQRSHRSHRSRPKAA